MVCVVGLQFFHDYVTEGIDIEKRLMKNLELENYPTLCIFFVAKLQKLSYIPPQLPHLNLSPPPQQLDPGHGHLQQLLAGPDTHTHNVRYLVLKSTKIVRNLFEHETVSHCDNWMLIHLYFCKA